MKCRARRVNCISCAVVSWQHVNHVRSRFTDLHVDHGLSYPLVRLSLRLTVTLCSVACNPLSYSLHRMNPAGFTQR